MNGYEELWEKFRRERRLEFGGHTDPDWQDGHNLSASFMIPVDADGIRERLTPLREALRPFPFVSLHPDHFMHITLLLPGFLVSEPKSEGELSHGRMEELANEAREALAGFPPFSAELRNLNAFPGAVFVEVHDRGEMVELREVIRARCGLSEPPGPPHLTVAYIQAPDDAPAPEAFVRTIERLRDRPVGELWVDRVELTLIDLGEEYPEPETFAEIPLGGQSASQE